VLIISLPETEEFEALELKLEHSLVSLSKWESIHEKAFYGTEEKTVDETLSYIEQMLVDDVPSSSLARLAPTDFVTITDYINSKQTATWFREAPSSGGSSEMITAELMYYWMIQFQIPFIPCESWHINRLMVLIKIAGIKQTKPRKMSKQEQAQHYREMNARRRQELGTAG
jgi:hypothetical protein